MTMRQRPQQQDLTDLLRYIAADSRNPAALIELYYWSVEPRLAEVMRQYIMLPEEVREALHAFLLSVTDDPDSVSFRVSADGELILSSPFGAELAGRLAKRRDKGGGGVH